MYEKSSTHYPRLDTELSPREMAHVRHSFERPRRLARLAMGIGCVALSATLVLQSDIAWHKFELRDTEPIIHSIAEPLNSNDAGSATVYIDGFAGQDGSWITEKMTKAIQSINDSRIYALEYDKAGININAIADKIASKAAEDNIDHLSLYGYSIGGTIATEIAYFLQDTYNLTIETIFLDHTPANAKSIRPDMRSFAAPIMSGIKTFKDAGIDIEYSGIARAVVDTALSDKVSLLQNSTTSLMRDQFLIGVSADPAHNLSKLKTDQRPDPVIVYISSTNPSTDYMVDDAKSEKDFRALAKKNGFPFVAISVNGAIHSRPDLTIPAYEEAFAAGKAEVQTAKEEMTGWFLLKSGTLVKYRLPTAR